VVKFTITVFCLVCSKSSVPPSTEVGRLIYAKSEQTGFDLASVGGQSYYSLNHKRVEFTSSVTVVPSNFVRLNQAKFSL
jgi:hypothetical protein